MRVFSLILLVALPALAAELGGSITLDPAEMENMKRLIFGGAALSPSAQQVPAANPAPSTAEEQLWLRAMKAQGDVQTILLLALLQQLNPGLPMDSYPGLYADALALHRCAAAAEPMAVANLESCLRSGALPGGLAFLRSDYLAQQFRQMLADKH